MPGPRIPQSKLPESQVPKYFKPLPKIEPPTSFSYEDISVHIQDTGKNKASLDEGDDIRVEIHTPQQEGKLLSGPKAEQELKQRGIHLTDFYGKKIDTLKTFFEAKNNAEIAWRKGNVDNVMHWVQEATGLASKQGLDNAEFKKWSEDLEVKASKKGGKMPEGIAMVWNIFDPSAPLKYVPFKTKSELNELKAQKPFGSVSIVETVSNPDPPAVLLNKRKKAEEGHIGIDKMESAVLDITNQYVLNYGLKILPALEKWSEQILLQAYKTADERMIHSFEKNPELRDQKLTEPKGDNWYDYKEAYEKNKKVYDSVANLSPATKRKIGLE